MQCGMLNSNSVYERHTKKKSKSFCSRDVRLLKFIKIIVK